MPGNLPNLPTVKPTHSFTSPSLPVRYHLYIARRELHVSTRVLTSSIVAILTLAFALGAPTPISAADTRTWTGNDLANANWTDPDNWDTGAPVAGDSLVFPPGADQLQNTNNFPPGTAFHEITFTGTGYHIDGASISLTGTLTNSPSGSGTNIINLEIAGPGSVTVTGGRLAFLSANTYAGVTGISGGASLLVSGNGSLGSLVGATQVANGSRLQLSNNANIGFEPVVLVGSGPGGFGALQSLSGTNRADAVVLNGAVTIGVGQSTLILRDLGQAGPGATLKLVGGGKLQVDGTGTFTGPVNVEHGNLTWNATNAPAVTVQKDGWLRGIGTVASITSHSGLVWPGSGSAPGVLTSVGGATLAGGIFRVDLDGPTLGSGYGQLLTSGGVSITSSLTRLELDLTFAPTVGQSFTIINAAAPTQGTFRDLPEGATFSAHGYAFSITYKGGTDGNDVVIRVLRQVAADLAAGISVQPSLAAVPGQLLVYTLTMHNAGPDPAVTPRFTIGIPAGTTFVSVSAPGWSCSTPPHTPSITCTGPVLPAGQTASIGLTVRVNAAATGVISATVATFSATNDPASVDNSATIVIPVGSGPGLLPFRLFLPGIAFDPGNRE